jgi:uncharacterized protein (TIGR00159 family)
LTDILESIGQISFRDVLDILIMSVVVYSALVWFKRTKAAFVVIGMFILVAAYLLAREIHLPLTVALLQGFFAIFVIAVVVIFQEEIKQFFEFLARWTASAKHLRRQSLEIPIPELEILCATLPDFAASRTGALIVLVGNEPIMRHLEGGISLNGEFSEELLRSIFDPHSAGHDGALVLHGNRVTQFGVHLPLSKNHARVGKGGTRHAAALGLSELSDALCLVVSEERGTISAARNGLLSVVTDKQELASTLESFYQETVPQQERKPWKKFFRKNYREKAIAVFVTAVLWFVFVLQSRIDYRTFQVPVHWSTPHAGIVVERVEPQEVELTFSGPRRVFFFVDEGDIRLSLPIPVATTRGSYSRTISESSITFPDGLTFEGSEPPAVTVEVTARTESN